MCSYALDKMLLILSEWKYNSYQGNYKLGESTMHGNHDILEMYHGDFMQ